MPSLPACSASAKSITHRDRTRPNAVSLLIPLHLTSVDIS
jgi:hypothetical protein